MSNFVWVKLEQTNKRLFILKLLYYYPKLDLFMHITKVRNATSYKKGVKDFNNNLIHYLEVVSNIILVTKVIGNKKNFYFYILFYYYSKLI